MEWLKRSFDDNEWKSYISSGKENIFDIYNLLYVAAFTNQKNTTASLEIVNHVYKTCRNDIENDITMRSICYLFIGYVMLEDEQLCERGRSILAKELVRSKEVTEADHTYIFLTVHGLLNGKNELRTLFDNQV